VLPEDVVRVPLDSSDSRANRGGVVRLGGTLVLAVDRMLVPPLTILHGDGRAASGAIEMAFTSSLTRVVSRI
jgi:acetyl-CoA carboxylase carboxyltransferase component